MVLEVSLTEPRPYTHIGGKQIPDCRSPIWHSARNPQKAQEANSAHGFLEQNLLSGDPPEAGGSSACLCLEAETSGWGAVWSAPAIFCEPSSLEVMEAFPIGFVFFPNNPKKAHSNLNL